MTGIGDTSHVILCETITIPGAADTATYDSTDEYQFIKAPTPKLGIKFNSKNKHSGYHKSRLSPDKKLTQSYSVAAGKMKAEDVNSCTEWIIEAYLASKKIYLLVLYPSGANWVNKSWYNDSSAKVYYLKGYLKNLDIKQKKGKIWDITFNFEESWGGS